jgi:predicted MPP superfamily phosphohydrolase
MKILFVGDVHATQNEVEECDKLLHFVDEISKTTKPDYILFAGDITHNHGILYPSVLHLWDKWLKCDIKTIILKGNHDCSLSESDLHCLNAFKRNNLTIVDKPIQIEICLFLPFMAPDYSS